MYFGAGIPQLNSALKDLRASWEATSDWWRDAQRNDLGEHTIEPLLAQSAATLRAMEQLADLFRRVYRECDDTE